MPGNREQLVADAEDASTESTTAATEMMQEPRLIDLRNVRAECGPHTANRNATRADCATTGDSQAVRQHFRYA